MGGGGSTYDYGFRIYNPQIARFLSVDPLAPSYPELTPYQYASNTPIFAIDLDGLEMLPGYFSWFMKTGSAIAKKVNDAETRAAVWDRTHTIVHKKEPPVLDKLMHRFEAYSYQFGEYSDMEDVSVLSSGRTVKGDKANKLDYTLAAGGFFIPFVSGGQVKQVLKGFYRTLEGSNADHFLSSRGVQTFEEFYDRAKKMSAEDRIAEFKAGAERIAAGNGWQKNSRLSKRNNRTIYSSDDGMHYAVDTETGSFEVLNSKGKHQGEINFNGVQIDPADATGKHDIITQ
jgi:hypothetical protein